MHGLFTYTNGLMFMVHVGKYTIHGCYGTIVKVDGDRRDRRSQVRWRKVTAHDKPLLIGVASHLFSRWYRQNAFSTKSFATTGPVERKTQASPSFVGQSNFKHITHITNNVKTYHPNGQW